MPETLSSHWVAWGDCHSSFHRVFCCRFHWLRTAVGIGGMGRVHPSAGRWVIACFSVFCSRNARENSRVVLRAWGMGFVLLTGLTCVVGRVWDVCWLGFIGRCTCEPPHRRSFAPPPGGYPLGGRWVLLVFEIMKILIQGKERLKPSSRVVASLSRLALADDARRSPTIGGDCRAWLAVSWFAMCVSLVLAGFVLAG